VEQIRTFIAIELDEAVVVALGELQSRLRREVRLSQVRWVRPEGIHLTLKFLGDVPADRVGQVGDALRRACDGFGPLSLTLADLGCFPNLRRPRVVWVGVQGDVDALGRLQASVEKHVAPLGFPTEKRRFSPHLTLGRVKRATRSEAQQLGQQIEKMDVGTVGTMTAQAVRLMRSDLKPTGAEYTCLVEVPLEGDR